MEIPCSYHPESEKAEHDPHDKTKPKCHPLTRVRVQREIVQWVKNKSEKTSESILWVYGPEKEGKSAISRSVAEREDMKDIFWGFYAFSRYTSVDTLVPTLAHQLSFHVPGMKQYITDAIDEESEIFTKSVEIQMQHLIQASKIRLIIIDGLDECSEPEVQRCIIRSIVNALSRSSINLRFLIFSRPEPEIQNTFKQNDIAQYCSSLELNEEFNPDQDIEILLKDKFMEIRRTRALSSSIQNEVWPTENDIMTIVKRSSGRFIYPVTIVDYIEKHRDDPSRQLQRILETYPITNEGDKMDVLHSLYQECKYNQFGVQCVGVCCDMPLLTELASIKNSDVGKHELPDSDGDVGQCKPPDIDGAVGCGHSMCRTLRQLLGMKVDDSTNSNRQGI
ncbi:hypothetical protein BDQ17DRAFT_1366363 [Cyathus striatus]|nr:hypothetical protein BDQ17DRAFT_1366363 [Cyathus striatus]